MSGHGETSTYTVHWNLLCKEGETAECGLAIRKSWWASPGVKGQRRLACDWLAQVVTVMAEVPADDIATALAATQEQVIRPLERAALCLPDQLVIVAARMAPRD